MTDDEVNRICAEFMGVKFIWIREDNMCIKGDMAGNSYIVRNYTKSLDALVPVWNKIHDEHPRSTRFTLTSSTSNISSMCQVGNDSPRKLSGAFGMTIQQASAHVLADTIKALFLKDKK